MIFQNCHSNSWKFGNEKLAILLKYLKFRSQPYTQHRLLFRLDSYVNNILCLIFVMECAPKTINLLSLVIVTIKTFKIGAEVSKQPV